MTSFDADTALEPAGPGRYRGAVPDTWSIGDGPNGGFMAALGARAAGLAAGAPPRTLTLHYLSRPAYAPIEVETELVRQGRSASFLRFAMVQEAKTVVTGLAVCGAWYEDAPAWSDAERPDLPSPEECVHIEPGRTHVPPLMGRYDMRVAHREPGRPARIGGWIRTADPHPADHVVLAAMTDAFMPPSFFRSPEPVAVPTLELTIHFRGLPPEDDHPFVLGEFVTRVAAGGVLEEDGELWSEDGRLLCQSRQLALVRRRS